MFAPLAVLFATLALAPPCRTPGVLRVYIEADPVSVRDTMMSARVCLSLQGGGRVGSVSGRVTVDTAFATVAGVVIPPSSSLFARDNGGGVILLAGASAQGLRAGTLVTVRARLARAGVLPRIDVQLTELNDAGGNSVITRATAVGLAPRCLGSQSAVFEVLPAVASADPGEPLDLRITGCGFHATKNTVRLGEASVPNVRSTDDGTRIRVVVAKEYRANGEVPPMQIGAGAYDVSVNNGRGASNARRVTLR